MRAKWDQQLCLLCRLVFVFFVSLMFKLLLKIVNEAILVRAARSKGVTQYVVHDHYHVQYVGHIGLTYIFILKGHDITFT